MSTPDRWDECRHPMAVSFPLNCLVDRTRIVGPVRCDGGQRIVDLVQELWHLDAVRRVPVGQIFSEDLACVRIDCQVDGGKVTNAWSSGQMWRGIEVILQGRDPRDAPTFTQRFCGV